LGVKKKNFPFEEPKILAKSLSDPVCVICEYAVKFLDYELRQNKTQAAIEKALEKVCRLVPGTSSRIQCESIISQYGGYITQILLEFDDQALICRTINLCKKREISSKALLFIFKANF
jgi:saposin